MRTGQKRRMTMGLDMYLTAKEYVWEKDRDKFKGVTTFDLPLSEVTYEVGYWRKANAIHKWFVDNVQSGVDDCGEYGVAIQQLCELLQMVNEVLKDPSKAMELLPPTSGFFFGSTEVNEFYLQNLKYTADLIEKIKGFPGGKLLYLYRSSW
jgi:hypothetical protein